MVIMRLFLWASVHIRKNRKGNIMNELERLMKRYPQLVGCREAITETYQVLEESFRNGGKLLICGNGGSAADSDHIVGELMKGFVKRRPVSKEFAAALQEADEKRGEELASCLQGGLPAIALTGHAGLATAFLNDGNGEMSYARQLYGYGKKGDVFIGISTSGNAENVMYAVAVAKASGIKTIGLNGGKMAGACDCSIVVPSDETFKIQELHLPIYHTLCLMLEEHFYEV